MASRAYVQSVAQLAVIYGECVRCRFLDLDDLLAADSDDLSHATLSAVSILNGLDWSIIRDLAAAEGDPDVYIEEARAIAPWFPHRADVILHTIPPDGHCAPGSWSAQFRRNWSDVHTEIDQLRTDGFAVTHGEMNEVADAALASAF